MPCYACLSTNLTFSLWCVPLIKSGSLNCLWSTKILSQFVTRMHKFFIQSDIKHIMTSPIKTIMPVLKASVDVITNITARPYRTHWDINDNVCLDLQNCHYSIYMCNWSYKDVLFSLQFMTVESSLSSEQKKVYDVATQVW